MKTLHKWLMAGALAIIGALGATAQQTPKYIFYFIGDGMGPGPVMAAMNYNRIVNGHDQLLMTALPVSSRAQTWSASSPVTDSAAGGTALATGSKTRNGMIGMNADTVAVYSVAKELKDKGYGIGLVTNCAADDATPAAFYAHQPNRSMYYEIGKDAASSGFDFIAGAGLRGAKDKKTKKPTDLYEVLAENNVQVLRGAQGVKQVYTSESQRIMLLNPLDYGGLNNMGYVIDGVGADSIGMTLRDAARACLYHLEKNSPDRFFMMVEGGLIDHALHGNDGASAIREILDFDETLRLAYDFYLAHPDETLIIVTADHDTGGMATGNNVMGYNAHYKNIDYATISKSAFSDFCKSLLKSRRVYTWEDMQQTLTDELGFYTHIKISDAQEAELEASYKKTFIDRTAVDQKGLYDDSNAFAALVFKIYNDNTGFGYTSTHHTGNFVPVFAIGVGAEGLMRTLNNIDIPAHIRHLTK